jgi:pimeloyl-ACP methyl ester carboxylesterase
VTRRALLLIPIAVALALVLALPALNRLAAPPAPLRFAMGRGPTIVLLHGAGSSLQHWLPTARLLARDHRVVLVELPGQGVNPMPEPLTLDGAAAALDAALVAEAKEPVVLVGHGVGGLVAAAEALDHPEHVRALVLVEAALRPQVGEEERGERLESIDLDYHRLLRRMYARLARDSAQAVKLYVQAGKADPATLKPWLRLELFADVSLRMRHLLPPLLAVFGERSWPREQPWTGIAQKLGYGEAPNAKTARLEGCGHFVMLDRPEELARLIEHFARDTSHAAVAAR